jgi:AcrR family transcriptional regulator
MARPRKFDENYALDAAMGVFWTKGYEGTTLEDLTQAMGINRPSLYGAFGNKEALFQKALARYNAGPAAYLEKALEASTAREAAERILRGAVDLGTHPDNPGGCLAVHGALATGDDAASVRKALVQYRAATETSIRKRFEQAQSDGDLSPKVNAADLARYITVVIRGMAVESASGATRAQLYQIIDLTMAAWPK